MLFYVIYDIHLSNSTTHSETKILMAMSGAHWHWMTAVIENCKQDLERFSKRINKYANQSRIEPASFEVRNMGMLTINIIKTYHPA
jgi:hypothetical protein